MALVGLLRSRAALEAEVLILRHQLNVLRRKCPKRVVCSDIDRVLFAGLYRLAPGVLDVLKVLKPETVIGWHLVSDVLALEIATRRWSAKHASRDPTAHSRHEPREPALGRAAYSR